MASDVEEQQFNTRRRESVIYLKMRLNKGRSEFRQGVNVKEDLVWRL